MGMGIRGKREQRSGHTGEEGKKEWAHGGKGEKGVGRGGKGEKGVGIGGKRSGISHTTELLSHDTLLPRTMPPLTTHPLPSLPSTAAHPAPHSAPRFRPTDDTQTPHAPGGDAPMTSTAAPGRRCLAAVCLVGVTLVLVARAFAAG